MSYFTVRRSAAAFVGILIAAASVSAETRVVSSLPFNLDGTVTPVDSTSVKFTAFGGSRIVSRDSVDDVLVEESYRHNAMQFSSDELWGFVQTALKEEKPRRGAFGLAQLLRAAPENENLLRVRSLPSDKAAADLFKETLSIVEKPDLSRRIEAAVLLGVALVDVDWVRTEAVSRVFALGPAFTGEVTARFRDALLKRAYDEADGVLDAEKELLGERDPHYQALRLTMSRIRQMLRDLNSGDTDRLLILARAQAEDEETAVLGPVVVEALHHESEKALRQGNSERALSLLANVGLDRRTETTHRLALEGLYGLIAAGKGIPEGSESERFVVALVGKDQKIREAYVAHLEQGIAQFLRKHQVRESEELLARLLLLRPDPDPKNDRLRLDQIAAYYRLALNDAASAKLTEIKTQLGIGARVGLWWAYLTSWTWTLMLVLLAVGIAVTLRTLQPYLRAAGRGAWRAGGGLRPSDSFGVYDIEEEPESERPRGFSPSSSSRVAAPAMQEYVELLKTFGLPPGASVKDIKRAYRASVKEYHPDAQQNPDAKASQRFIELTQAYDRLLELRADLNLL